MTILTAPDRTEAAAYYFTYIDRVGGGDIRRVLEDQAGETLALLEKVTEEQSLHRYALGKWSLRQVVSHLNDSERVFVFRALWFARGLEGPLPSFEQTIAAAAADADARLWRSHLEEFRAVRAATVAFFRELDPEVWSRRGVASGNPVTVRALAYIVAGHVAHHMSVIRERYLPGMTA